MPIGLPNAPVTDATAAASPSVAMMEAARRAREQKDAMQKQLMDTKAAEEQRANQNQQASTARETRAQAGEQNVADTHAMANDLTQWSQEPEMAQYRVPWDQAPAEVRSHVQTAYPGVQSAAPKVWNDAYTANTGNAVATRVPLTPAQRITAQQHGVELAPTDGVDEYVAKLAAKQAQPLELTPDQQKMAEEIANYDLPTSQAKVRVQNPDVWAKMLATAGELGYDAKEYPTRVASRRDFTSGKAAQSITSLNTVIHHLGNALEANAKMSNTGMGPYVNAPINAVRRGFGNPDVTAYETNANAVAEEMAKLLKGGVATKSEIDEWKASLSPNLSPDQLKQNIGEMMRLIAGRVDGLRNQWQSAYSRPRDLPFLDVNSRDVLKNHGFEPGAIDPAYAAPGTRPAGQPGVLPPAANAPQGQQPAAPEIPQVNSQQEYDALPAGAQYRDSNGRAAEKKSVALIRKSR